MSAIFAIFENGTGPLMASVVAFSAFFLIGRVAHAGQKVAFAFGFTPLIAFAAVHTAAASGLV
jgi:hypothetical protein